MATKDNYLRGDRFATEVLAGADPIETYKKLYAPPANLSELQLRSRVSTIMNGKRYRQALDTHRQRVGAMAALDAASIMREWWDIATADPRELIQYMRNNCRHCFGKDFKYQWIGPREFAEAIARVVDQNAKIPDPRHHHPLPVNEGGFGFRMFEPVNPKCEVCGGKGSEYVWLADTRNLTGKAAKLYAGVKQTPNGIQVLMRDQDGALDKIAKALAMYAEKVVLTTPQNELNGASGIPADPILASQYYAQLMRGD